MAWRRSFRQRTSCSLCALFDWVFCCFFSMLGCPRRGRASCRCRPVYNVCAVCFLDVVLSPRRVGAGGSPRYAAPLSVHPRPAARRAEKQELALEGWRSWAPSPPPSLWRIPLAVPNRLPRGGDGALAVSPRGLLERCRPVYLQITQEVAVCRNLHPTVHLSPVLRVAGGTMSSPPTHAACLRSLSASDGRHCRSTPPCGYATWQGDSRDGLMGDGQPCRGRGEPTCRPPPAWWCYCLWRRRRSRRDGKRWCR